MSRSCLLSFFAFLIVMGPHRWLFSQQTEDSISFKRDIRPLLVEKCFGCHQPLQGRGGFVVTAFEQMLAGGDSGVPAVVPGDSQSSKILELITSDNGEAEMPPDADAFTEKEVNLIRNWIDQGARNDFTRETALISPENPPRYSRLPNISSLDISSDGKLLAVSGFHEVLLLELPQPEVGSSPVIQGKIVQRLIGLSARIESVQFSPAGNRLAVSGGVPGEFGEVQVWNVDDGEILLSKIVSHDTVYGISWSPDGTRLSFGCSDTTLRAIDSETGEQVLYQSAHDDWVRDSLFSLDGSQIVSVGRDMSCKLVDVETQRFIDNITSITPGVLKGGIASVARHPKRNEVLIGGADGIPKIYRMNRVTKRVIGDDANLIRRFPQMPGRIQSVAISNDGLRLVAGSSHDGSGAVRMFSYPPDLELTKELKKILAKTVGQQSSEEKRKLDEYVSNDVASVASIDIPESGIYAVEFHPDGKWLAAAGRDGFVRLIETDSGKLLGTLKPVPLHPATNDTVGHIDWRFREPPQQRQSATSTSKPPAARRIIVSPEQIEFRLPIDYAQLVVQAELDDGSLQDVTHDVDLKYEDSVIAAKGQLIQVAGPGQTDLEVNWNGLVESIPVSVELVDSKFEPDFKRDVNPVLTKLGCNAGTCHGSQGGKKGFKLSLRGYDPVFDIRALTDDMASRRINIASPDSSLVLLKPTAQVAHEGGMVLEKDGRYFNLVRDWIRNGARLNQASSSVKKIELFPQNPMLNVAGESQQVRVVATYDDGVRRDVTREAIVSVGNLEVAEANESKITALRRGESPILARFDGAFAATTLTVMGDRKGFVWNAPDVWGSIDELVAAKWKRMKIEPSTLCTDAEFIRRVYLDLTGLPPTAQQVQNFLDDPNPTREKRDELVEQLVGSESYIEHWSNKWADLLQVNRKYLGPEGARAFRDWIREQVKANRPYDEFAYDILTASGSNRENPAASYYKIHRTPVDVMENTTHLFLATRFNCNKCHDHPFERWTQDQYYETAAYFSQIGREKDPASGDKKIAGTAVEDSQPLYELIADLEEGDVSHVRTGEVVLPEFPFSCDHEFKELSPRRTQLASWLTSPNNPYFATSYVNRLWGYMTGTGLIEPLDDIRAGNPPTNPELLELLRSEFVENGFDTQHMLKMICKSRTYQLSIATNEFNADDRKNYSHGQARRLPAEVLFDSIHFVTGAQPEFPGVEPGMRAAALPDSGVTLPSGLLATLGRPSRESACECERVNDMQLGSVLALTSGPDLSRAINDPNNQLAELVKSEDDDRALIDMIVMRILNRHATKNEVEVGLAAFTTIESDHKQLTIRRDEELAKFEKHLPELKRLREIAIKHATAELKETVAELDPKLAERESRHAAELAAATNELQSYLNQPDGFSQWKNRMLSELSWHPLVFSQVETLGDRGFRLQEDRSILFKKKSARDVYSLVAASELTGISAVRLELMPDESLSANGPGLAENGNLVLTEFKIQIAHPDRPDQWEDIPVASVLASISQEHYPVTNSIDGQIEGQGGWAIGNNIGKTSWATYQLKLPVGYSGGSLLRFKLFQDYDDLHQIGRLRISVCNHHQPVGLGLSEQLLAQLGSPEKDWTKEDKETLQAVYEKGDAKLIALRELVAEKEQPLKIAPQIVKLREKLTRASRPVSREPILVQLEEDAAASEEQLKDHRLTAAQDFAWALINSPSFLFNR